MNHSYFSDRLSAFKDGALPPYEQAALAKHVEDCPECQSVLVELEKLDRLIEQQSLLGGGNYWEQQAQAIEQRLGAGPVTDVRSSARGSGLFWKWASVAASVAVLTFIGLHQSDIFQDEKLIPRGAAPPVVKDTTTYHQLLDRVAGFEGQKGKSESKGLEESEHDQPSQTPDVVRSPAIRFIQPPVPVVLEPTDSHARLTVPTTADTANRGLTDAVSEYGKTERQQLPSMMADQVPSLSVGVGDTVAAPSEEVIFPAPDDLELWRRTVDSLSRLLLSYGKRRGLVERPAADQSADSVLNQERQASTEQLEAELLRASFYLAILSSDSAEIRRATGLIEGVAADEKSVNRSLAEQYLRQLKKRPDSTEPAKK